MKAKFLLSLLAILVLSGCTSLDRLKKEDLSNINSFNVALAQEYLAFSESEADQYDWIDSGYFARKGLAALRGMDMLPEDVSKWDIPANEINTISWARERLVKLLTPELKQQNPKKLAKAQYYFDCWVEQQEENWQIDDINECRMGFLMEVNGLEYSMKPIIPEPSQLLVPSVMDPLDSYTVYFKFNKENIDKDGRVVINKAIERANSMADYKVIITGHADKSGSDEYNSKLSKKRADSIAAQILDGGVTRDSMEVNSLGETSPAKPTADGVAEKLNRRVEITIHGNK